MRGERNPDVYLGGDLIVRKMASPVPHSARKSGTLAQLFNPSIVAVKQSVKRVVSMKYTDFVNSIQGLVKVEATDKGITAIEFVSAAESDDTANEAGVIGRETAAQESMLSNGFHSQKNAITEAACSQLQAYFDGTLREFDLPLCPKGAAFQNPVWDGLQHVKYGETASYLDIAKAIGKPKAVRAWVWQMVVTLLLLLYLAIV